MEVQVRSPQTKIGASQELLKAIEMASDILKISLYVQKNLCANSLNEENVIKGLTKFLNYPSSALALQFAPHLISTLTFCTKSSEYSQAIKNIVDKCLKKCCFLFGLSDIKHFLSVYKTEAKKNIPTNFGEKLLNHKGSTNKLVRRNKSNVLKRYNFVSSL